MHINLNVLSYSLNENVGTNNNVPIQQNENRKLTNYVSTYLQDDNIMDT